MGNSESQDPKPKIVNESLRAEPYSVGSRGGWA